MAYYPNEGRMTRLGRPAKYNWDIWADGTERLLREGHDFTCMAESFVILARRTAKVRGLHVVATIAKCPEDTADLKAGTYVRLQFKAA